MKKEIVGNKIWNISHKLAINSNNKNNLDDYIVIILYMLQSIPCKSCKKEIDEIIENFNIDDIKKDSLFVFTNKVHNIVNRKLNKPEVPLKEALVIQSEPLYRDDVWDMLHIIAASADEHHRKRFYIIVKKLFTILEEKDVINLIPTNTSCNDNEQILIWTIFARNDTNIEGDKNVSLMSIQKMMDGKCENCELNEGN